MEKVLVLNADFTPINITSVYKSVLEFQKNNNTHQFFTIDTDWGVGVIIKNIKPIVKYDDDFYQKGIENWDFFDENRKKLLNLISINEFNEFLNGI
jgi:hypothetical protein